MILHKKQAFTVVELMVVMTVLSILTTIAFISFQGYSATSRDTVRISDAEGINTVLKIYYIQKYRYPEPDKYKEVSYSGGVIWKEGTFGDGVVTTLSNLEKVPKDPLVGVEYTYSLLNTTEEYSLGIALEQEHENYTFSKRTYASSNQFQSSYISGTYNEKIAETKIGTTKYILSIPSIISTDPNDLNIEEIVSEKKLAYNGFGNLPSSYNGVVINTKGEDNLNLTNELVVYSGSIFPQAYDEMKVFVSNLQTAYINTEIEEEPKYTKLLSVDTENIEATNAIGASILSNNLGAGITAEDVSLPEGCNASSSYLYNTHTYNLPSIDHESQLTITSSNVSENNGVFNYNLTVSCNDGVRTIESESNASNVSCDTGYTWDNTSCTLGAVDQIVSTGSLISYYPFNGDSLDYGQSYDLNQSGGPVFVNDGINGQAMRFDGSNDYLYTSTSSRYLDLSAATFAFWVRYNGTIYDPFHFYFSKYNCGNGGRNATFSSGNNLYMGYMIPPYYWRSLSVNYSSPFQVDTWHHLAFTAGSSGMRMYLDGVLIGSNTSTNASVEYNTEPFLIGNHASSGCSSNPFKGDMDEFAIWGRQLSDTEIATLAGQ